jgi:hypothetical protein
MTTKRDPHQTLDLPPRPCFRPEQRPTLPKPIDQELVELQRWAWNRWEQSGDRWDLIVSDVAGRAAEALTRRESSAEQKT